MKIHFLAAFFLMLATILAAAPAPDFTVTDSDGAVHHLYDDYVNQNKVLVIEIFFTTCPPCNTHAPHWQNLYQNMLAAYPGKVEFMMLSNLASDSNTKVATYKTNKGLTMPGVGATGGSLTAVQPYEDGDFGDFWGTPTFIVIAPGTGEVYFDIRANSASATMTLLAELIDELVPRNCFVANQNGAGLDSVTLRAETGSDPGVFYYAVTDSGAYTPEAFGLTGTPDDTWILAPSKNDDILNGVTTFDLVMISKHILSLDTFTQAWQHIAADVNNTGSVTTFDITIIRKVILGVTDTFQYNRSWVFDPPVMERPLESCIEFTATKLGDVNGNASTHALAGTDDRNRPTLELALPNQRLQAGERYRIPLRSTADAHWLALQLPLHIDPAALRIDNMHSETLPDFDTDAFYLGKQQQGRAPLSWFAPQAAPLPAGQTLLSLDITALRDADLAEVLRIDELQPAVAWLDDGAEYAPVLEWREAGTTGRAGIVPNPARDNAVLYFHAGSRAQQTIEIRDLHGRLRRQKTVETLAGENAVALDGAGLEPGVYIVSAGGKRVGAWVLQ